MMYLNLTAGEKWYETVLDGFFKFNPKGSIPSFAINKMAGKHADSALKEKDNIEKDIWYKAK